MRKFKVEKELDKDGQEWTIIIVENAVPGAPPIVYKLATTGAATKCMYKHVPQKDGSTRVDSIWIQSEIIPTIVEFLLEGG